MLERYLEKVSDESSSEPIIKAAIELAAFAVKEGPVFLCSCLSYLIAANKRLKQEVKSLQKEVEDLKNHCSCKSLPASPSFRQTEEQLLKCNGRKRDGISQEIDLTEGSGRKFQQSAAVGSVSPASCYSPYTRAGCLASSKNWTTSSHQNHYSSSSLSDRLSPSTQSHVSDNNNRFCCPQNDTALKSADETSSTQLDSGCSLASGQLLMTVVAEVHTVSSADAFCDLSDENLGSKCRKQEQTCNEPDESEVVSPLPLLGCLCKACLLLLQDPTCAAFVLNDDAEEGIVAPGNRVVVEVSSFSVPLKRQRQENARAIYPVSPADPLPQDDSLPKNFTSKATQSQMSGTTCLEDTSRVGGTADARVSPDHDPASNQDLCSNAIFMASACTVDESEETFLSCSGDQVVTVVYFGHERETVVSGSPLLPRPVGIVALFTDGVERFVPLSRVMYHFSDDDDARDTDHGRSRSLSPQQVTEGGRGVLSRPVADGVTAGSPFVEESIQAMTGDLPLRLSTFTTTNCTAQPSNLPHPVDPSVHQSSVVTSFGGCGVPDQQNLPGGSSVSCTDISDNFTAVPEPSRVSVMLSSSKGATASNAETRQVPVLRRSQSDASCDGGALSSASHSLECLSLCAGETGRYLNTSSDSEQWAHFGYDNAAFSAAQDELSKLQQEDAGDGSCNNQHYESSWVVPPISHSVKKDEVRLNIHDVYMYESSDSAISVSFANSQQSSFWSTAASSGRSTFQSLSTRDGPAGKMGQCREIRDSEASVKNRIMEPGSLNSDTSWETFNSRILSTSEDSGTDVFNRALNVFRRRNSTVDIFSLQNVSNV